MCQIITAITQQAVHAWPWILAWRVTTAASASRALPCGPFIAWRVRLAHGRSIP